MNRPFCKAASVGIWPQAWMSFLILVLGTFLLQGCGLGPDRVAGTSSGVDNPQLTVAFSDSTGTPAAFSGTLSLYNQDQNPALDAQPLASLRIDNRAYVTLSGLDFSRSDSLQWLSLAGSQGLFKAATMPLDSLVAFNVYLRTDDKQGAFATGFRYDARKHRFLRENDSTLTRVSLSPKALVTVQAAITRNGKGEGLERVFIPGTPFVAVLVESLFTFDELPEGLFDLKILTGEGNLLPVRQALNPHLPGHFNVDDSGKENPPDPKPTEPDFSVFAGEDHSTTVQSPSFLEGRIVGSLGSGKHVSWLWRQIEGPGSMAVFRSPTEPKTVVTFSQPGLYRFELAAGVGSVIRLDTVMIAVEASNLDLVRFIIPFTGQVLTQGHDLHISWQGQKEERLSLQFSADSGKAFTAIGNEIKSRPGINEYGWDFGNLPVTESAVLRLINDAGGTVMRSGVFSIRKPPPIEMPPQPHIEIPPPHNGMP